ncbi:MAG: TonB-dependent hemoglobin/transferrin/lactoferrin family receptor, partial [Pseudomonadota bacterium]
ISEEELARRMDVTIEDVFRFQPGIEVSRQTTGTDPFSSLGGVQIRGVGGNRTQILVDGTRTIERITDSTRDVVDGTNLKAVEVVRGPASVLWGSDGLGGVVNFVTKDPSDLLRGDDRFAGQASISYADLDDTTLASVTAAFNIAPELDGLISYTRRDASEIELSNARTGSAAIQNCTRSPEATQCDEFDPLDIESDSVLGKLVWRVSDNNQLRLTGEYFSRQTDVSQNSVLGPVFSFGGALTANLTSYERTQDINRWRISVDQSWSPELAWLDTLEWQLSHSPQQVNRNGDRRRTLVPSGDLEQFLDDQELEETFTELDIQLTSSFNLGPVDHTLTYGFDGDMAETDYNRVDTTRNLTAGTETIRRAGGFNFADSETTRADFYLQDEISFLDGRLTLIPGVRAAYYEIDPSPDADYEIVPGAEPGKIDETDIQLKLGSIFEFNNTYSAYAQYSEGFKMPTAQQLFQSLDSLPFFALVPNPNLTPESVESYEIGLRGDFGRSGFFSVNAFYADYTDFIRNFISADPEDFGLPPGSQVLTYDNVDKLELYGVEASTVFELNPNWVLSASASWQEGEEKNNGVETDYLGALPFQAVTGIRYTKPEHGLDLELVGTFQAGDADVNNEDTQFSPDGYVTFDAIGSWEVVPGTKLRLSVYNILDERYFPAETLGFPCCSVSDNVKRVNPIELQVAPGRNFKVGLTYEF